MKWYHGTSKQNAEKALKEGVLKPGQPSVYNEDIPRYDAVYITDDPKVAREYAGKDGVVLEVAPTGKFVIDEDVVNDICGSKKTSPVDVPVKQAFLNFMNSELEGMEEESYPNFESAWEAFNEIDHGAEHAEIMKSIADDLNPKDTKNLIKAYGRAAHIGPVKIVGVAKAAAKKVELVKTPGFVIEVPKERRPKFFVRPKTPLEYWAFKNRPRVFINEQIIFTFNGKPVAEAVVVKIDAPGGKGEHKDWHKVYWKPSRFKKFRGVTASEDLYHVTLQQNVDDIMENGLKAEHGKEFFDDQPKSTFLTERKGLNFWKNEIADYYGDPVTVVRVSTEGLNLIPDEQGTHDAGGAKAYRVEHDIPPQNIKLATIVPKAAKVAQLTEEPDYYMTEGCGIFAVDYAKKNGGEIYVMAADRGEGWSDEIPYEVTHAFVKKDGKTFDIRGERSPDKMAWELSMGGYTIKGPWTPEAFEAKFMGSTDDKPLFGNTAAKTASVAQQLQSLMQQDQQERKNYEAYLPKFNDDWRQAAQAYAKDKGRPANDIFGDATRLNQAKQLIRPSIQEIAADPSALHSTWLLVQHMDKDVAFQKWFLQYLQPGSQDFKYLSDRIAVNSGKAQQYGTQNVNAATKKADQIIDVGEGDEYWAGEGNAASGILPICPQKGTVCLAWRSQYVMGSNCWGTIGGAVQKGKSPQESAKAELKEEMGYSGGMTLIPAFVFTDRAFTYHNYIGVTSTEFKMAPKPYTDEQLVYLQESGAADFQFNPGWETDHITWVPYAEVVKDMQDNPEEYHPGLLKLFNQSKDAIERALKIEPTEKTAAHSPACKCETCRSIPKWKQPWLTGQCDQFALALHEKMPDAEFVAIGKGLYEHVGLKRGDKYYDVRGELTLDQFVALFGYNAGSVHTVTKEDVMKSGGYGSFIGHEDEFKETSDMAKARNAVRAVKIAGKNCPSGKKKFFDEVSAIGPQKRWDPGTPQLRAYKCPLCGWFHLTSKAPFQNAQERAENWKKQQAAEQTHMFPNSQDAKFRQWFDGSKVVDKAGNPMPVYHGTRSSVEFEEFAVDGPPQIENGEGETTSSGSGADPTAFIGAHFAEEANVANQFAQGTGWTKSRYEGENEKPRVIQVFLRITNPKDFGGEGNLHSFIYQGKISEPALDIACRMETGFEPWEEVEPEDSEQVEAFYQKYDNDQSYRAETNRKLLEDYRPMDMEDDQLRDAAYELAMQARGKLEASGHDGVSYKNEVEGGHAWIAFAANQIKSAWSNFDARDPRFTASVKTSAPLHDEAKTKTYYHGTDDEAAAQAILSGGIQPREITMPSKAKSRAMQAPVPDRVYLTDSIDYAAIYAMGGQSFGMGLHDQTKTNYTAEMWLNNHLKNGEYGYIFEVKGADLSGDILPDEDSIGEALAWVIDYRKSTQRMRELETQPERYEGEKKSLANSMKIIKEQPITSAPEDIQNGLVHMAQYLTQGQLRRIDEAAVQAQVGKKLQKKLAPAVAKWLLDNGAHIAHQGPVFPTHAWRFSKKDALYTNDWQSILQEVPVQAQKAASVDYEYAQKLGLWFTGADSKEADWKSKYVLPTALALGLGAPSMEPTTYKPPAPISAPAVQEKQVTLDELVEAIRRTEGADPDLHNPGNLVGFHSGQIMQFENDAQGEHALKNALKRIADGKNPNFAPDITLEGAGKIYANGDPNWAKNVSKILSVDPQTSFVKLIRGKAKVAAITYPTQTEPQGPTEEHPDVMYHTTGSSNRFSVLKNGLLASMSDAAQMGGDGAVFFDTKIDEHEGRWTDVWQVDVKGLELEPDWTTDLSGRPEWEGHEWWIFYGNIPSKRLKLVRKGETSTQANWAKRAAGFTFKSFKKLWHVGTMNSKDKRNDSYEGAGLSVSVNPEEWQQIARIGGDLWELTKPGNKFVNLHRLSKAQRKQITDWGIKNGYAQPAELWRHSFYDEELDDTRYSDYATKEEAEAELGGYGGDEKIEPVKGGLTATPKLSQKSKRGKIDPLEVMDLLVTAYAEDELDCDGVWWADDLDPDNLSAPRGVIFPSKLPTWKKRKVQSATTKTASAVQPFYHGTTWAAADKIDKEGLKAHKWQFGPESYVWASIIPEQGHSYGLSVSGEDDYAVVTFLWDYDKTEPDPEHEEHPDVYRRIPSNVPRSVIQSIEYFDWNGDRVKTASHSENPQQ